jgi:hypothetical protein
MTKSTLAGLITQVPAAANTTHVEYVRLCETDRDHLDLDHRGGAF